MEAIGYLGFFYLLFMVFLGIRGTYLEERLLKYVDKQYPEEGNIIRTHAWQMYPGSVGQRTLKALIKKQSAIDSELARQYKKVKRNYTCLTVLFVLALIIFFICVLFFLVK